MTEGAGESWGLAPQIPWMHTGSVLCLSHSRHLDLSLLSEIQTRLLASSVRTGYTSRGKDQAFPSYCDSGLPPPLCPSTAPCSPYLLRVLARNSLSLLTGPGRARFAIRSSQSTASFKAVQTPCSLWEDLGSHSFST